MKAWAERKKVPAKEKLFAAGPLPGAAGKWKKFHRRHLNGH